MVMPYHVCGALRRAMCLVMCISTAAVAASYSAAQYGGSGSRDPARGSIGGFPTQFPPSIAPNRRAVCSYSYQNGSGSCHASCEVFNARQFGEQYPNSASSSVTARAQVSVSVSRQWQPDEGGDGGPPIDASGSANGGANASWAVSCVQAAGCGATALASAQASTPLQAEGQANSAGAPSGGHRTGGSVPIEDPAKYADSDGSTGTFSVSTTISGAATIQVTVSANTFATASRTSNTAQATSDTGLAAAGASLSVSL